MKNIIIYLALGVLTLPCFLLFNEPIDSTGEWNFMYNMIGAAYSWAFFSGIKNFFNKNANLDE